MPRRLVVEFLISCKVYFKQGLLLCRIWSFYFHILQNIKRHRYNSMLKKTKKGEGWNIIFVLNLVPTILTHPVCQRYFRDCQPFCL